MECVTFKATQHLDWTNDLIDFLVGMSLFLRIYDERSEAEDFRKSRDALRQECTLLCTELAQKAPELRRKLDSHHFGTSRENSQRFMTKVVKTFSVHDCLNLCNLSDFASPVAKSVAEDLCVQQVFNQLVEFSQRYHDNYIRKELGGVFMFMDKLDDSENSQVNYVRNEMTKIIEPISDQILDYLKCLIHLYFDVGLCCWWAPLWEFNLTIASSCPSTTCFANFGPTLDGILGSLFKRDIRKRIYSSNAVEHSAKRIYKEWMLASMTRNQSRLKLGVEDNQFAHELMESWGYHHGMKWDQTEFNCLFDRLYLKSSVLVISRRYYLTDSKVQSCTSKLSKLMMLELPRASRELKH
ncbi:hypothetical protein [Dehalococcoides mccartyi]|uniref:hypothetical protein n=1 Tax=Dehalococcoides mccartyi TaxID=61435 RepID=UPI000804EE1E|nr:hypothetical protein [Dehalococcoides mccartyi]OBW61070.1 MAG: hypothetical protein A9181_07205 [Dehalococcoides mccartyi]OBW62561.1 MAG: hypothetical protein A9183_07670 [Dehalococcoides mccartyi]